MSEAIRIAYGRGFRRALEAVLRHPETRIMVAINDVTADRELIAMFRKTLLLINGPDVIEGFDSINDEPDATHI